MGGYGVENPFIPFTRIRITEDRNVTATFEINSVEILCDGGTSAGSGIYDWNSKIPISATARMVINFRIGPEMALKT